MSFDLVVFDKSVPVQSRSDFLDWYETKVGTDGETPDPDFASEALCKWFDMMTQVFPAMNGRSAVALNAENEARITDYNCGADHIYASFAWSVSTDAFNMAKRAAADCAVGIFNASSDTGEVFAPNSTGQLVLVHSE